MDWKDIEKELHEMNVEESAVDKDDFWQDFRARAELINQDGESALDNSYNPGWVRWAVIISCFIIVAALVFHFSQTTIAPGHERVGPGPKNGPTQMAKNEILELDILASNGGCIIMEEEETTLIMIYPEDE